MQYFNLGFVPDANLNVIVSSKNINKNGKKESKIENRLETKTFINCGKYGCKIFVKNNSLFVIEFKDLVATRIIAMKITKIISPKITNNRSIIVPRFLSEIFIELVWKMLFIPKTTE